MKRDLTKIFIDETFTTPLRKNYPTDKITHNHIDETRSIDLADMIDYKTSNNKKVLDIYSISLITSPNVYAVFLRSIKTLKQ